jgi:hypothetical protein
MAGQLEITFPIQISEIAFFLGLEMLSIASLIRNLSSVAVSVRYGKL